MAIRLHEVHPSIVHFPLALVPVSLAFDAIGWLTGRRALMKAGKALMPVAAGSALVTGATGLIAQQSVRAEGEAHDLLVTHRNLNLALSTVVTAMAMWRGRRETPNGSYLLGGLAGVLGMMYTAYLGGRMVYEHGVGVEKAGGVRDERSPELLMGNVGEVVRASGRNVVDGVAHVARETRAGELAPAVRPRSADVRRDEPTGMTR